MKRVAMVMVALMLLSGLNAAAADDPFADFTRAWRENPVWRDGKAECAVYDATRTIYGKVRNYQARLYTNREHADAVTKTKNASNRGREVFKHHLREDIATKNYNYHYSTMVYVGLSDLKSLKIDMGSQEDCGATFKQYINHKGELTWQQFSYFPDQGHKEGKYAPPADFAYQDAMSLVLRGYPFERPGRQGERGYPGVKVMLLADQTTTKLSPSKATAAVISYVGKETLDLPMGKIQAHHVRISGAGASGKLVHGGHDYWFAADPKMLHIMVQYHGSGGESGGGISLKLRSVERRAYWK